MGKICCFAGHGDFNYSEKTRKEISDACRNLIENKGVDEFWVGESGAFNRLATDIIKELKKEYSVELNVFVPYLTKEIRRHGKRDYKDYDNILISELPENIKQRDLLERCDEYMIDCSDYIVIFIEDYTLGVVEAYKYAKKTDIEILLFHDR